ncbi:MAG: UvrD-helicase domain-containing protein [Planctomycetes bacterium]|nr:UvrD-helicase domain-containing protein [Planctomycetota bacterium]
MSTSSRPRQEDLGMFADSPAEKSGRRDASELLAGLNDAQRTAVLHADGPLLILAGAGSGKTRVITRRIAYLVRERGLRPDEILAITFTNKAAGEMRERVEHLFAEWGTGVSARGMWVSTFHSMCARILRRDIELLGDFTRDFSIYDTDDRNRVIKEIVEREGYDTTRFKPSAIGAWISKEKNVSSGLPAATETGDLERDVFTRVAAKYDETMRRSNALDFDDLLLRVVELFEKEPGVRDSYARRFRQVMVDEYQDTNRVQYLLMRNLASFHENLAACGDPDQSIYGWRGADVRNILEFERDFPNTTTVRLEQNYRSAQNILKAAQAVIRNNRQRKEKDLWSERELGARVQAIECGDEDDEAREISAQIKGLVARGITHDKIAIFYRANFMQRAIERALRLSSIPYQIVAGTEFFQRREIKDLVAWLRVLVNPSDDEACRRTFGAPSRGIGDKTVDELSRWCENRRVPLSTAVKSEEARRLVRGKGKSALVDLAAIQERLRSRADGPALAALEAVIQETDYWKWLESQADRDDVDRAANVEELLANAGTYDQNEPDGGVRGFLQDIALVSDVDGLQEGVAKVSLMTLHSAKGLEFPAVFIAGLEENLLPHSRAIGEAENGEAAIEEERRLFYVGMTRAQEHLVLTLAKVRRHFGQTAWCDPSRFLGEIPAELLEGYSAQDDFPSEPSYVAEVDDDPMERLTPGVWVEHEHFGRGVVLRLSGSGPNTRVSVRFTQYGEKMLIQQYAKLRRLDADVED